MPAWSRKIPVSFLVVVVGLIVPFKFWGYWQTPSPSQSPAGITLPYIVDSHTGQLVHDCFNVSSTGEADVTAVILNWSRLPNVIHLVSHLCGPLLEDTIQSITIWNNHPASLTHSDFSSTDCPPGKLKIYNSAENIYFQARFIACSQASTPYCFIQDDDYLVRSPIIRAMRRRMRTQTPETGVHILPAHEMLTSQLRRVHVGPSTQTAFAWLGHGALIPRNRAAAFLSLLRQLKASDEEMKMADNYFTILANHIPETWFDQGVELGGGEPFTAGAEGHDRNKRHILRAAQFLDIIWKCKGNSSCSYEISGNNHTASRRITERVSEPIVSYASCRHCPYILETSISLLPRDLNFSGTWAADILQIESDNVARLGTSRISHYVAYPPSLAVDGRIDTSFRSPEAAVENDYVLFNLLDSVSPRSSMELVLVIDYATVDILKAGVLESSKDRNIWHPARVSLGCSPINLAAVQCQIAMLGYSLDGAEWDAIDDIQYIRFRLTENLPVPWCIFEMWVKES